MATTPTNYTALVAKYTKSVNTEAVDAIVKYCGPALKSMDSRYVAASDKAELGRIVKGYCAKKLGLEVKTATSAVEAAAERMKADRMKHRVPFYYLIGEHAGKLGALSGKTSSPKAKAKASKAPRAAAEISTKPSRKSTSAPVAPMAATGAALDSKPVAAAPAPVRAASMPTEPVRATASPVAAQPAQADGRWYMRGSNYDELTTRYRFMM